MGVMVQGVTPMGWVGDKVGGWPRVLCPCNRRGPWSGVVCFLGVAPGT